MAVGLTRKLRLGCYGKDVQAVRRIANAYLRRKVPSAPLSVQRTFGPGMQSLLKDAADEAGLPKYGVIEPRSELWEKFVTADVPAGNVIDAYAWQLLAQYKAEQTPVKPKLVEPRQGFHSLHESLWEAYSIGRRMGLSDLGTYNPRSRLPGGGKADHAYYPAYAFDLGVEPDTGYYNAVGREFFDLMCDRPEVNYVILGDRIWSRSRGLHWYRHGGHGNHVHVSGVH